MARKVPIHEMTRKEFTSPNGRQQRVWPQLSKVLGWLCGKGGFLRTRKWHAARLWPLREPSNVPGFSIAHEGETSYKGIVCVWKEATRELVGCQFQGVPYVLPAFRRMGIGTQIQLRVFETGIKTQSTRAFFAPGGLGTRIAAHRFAVARALENGQHVPDRVLADYKDLVERKRQMDPG